MAYNFLDLCLSALLFIYRFIKIQEQLWKNSGRDTKPPIKKLKHPVNTLYERRNYDSNKSKETAGNGKQKESFYPS